MKYLPFDWKPAIVVGIGVLVFLLLQYAGGSAGTLAGSDDMMRLQQVRDLLAGQSWYDVDQRRMLTPEGGAMHWSRLPDMLLAALILILKPLMGATAAENTAIILWPLMLFGTVSAGLVALLRNLGATSSAGALCIIVFFFSAAIYQYSPGRIDHHGLVAALVIVSLACLTSLKQPVKAGALAGLCVAAMLSIAIESLPFVAGVSASAAVLWVSGGAIERLRMAAFSGALIVGAGLLFMLDAPGLGVTRDVCDAFGTVHLIAAVVGGLGLLVLCGLSNRLNTLIARWAAMVFVGGVVIGLALLTAPQCLGDPYANLSPDVTENWLKTIGEARSIGVAFSQDPAQAIMHFGFIFAGLLAGGIAIYMAEEKARIQWSLLLTLLIGAALLTAWQARAAVFAHLLASVPVGWLLGKLFDTYRRDGGVGPLLKMAIAVALLMPVGWEILGNSFASRFMGDSVEKREVCEDTRTISALNAYPPARIFTPIDVGPKVIVSTPHSVFAGPYHRNPEGITRIVEAFVGPVTAAEQIVKGTGADYLLYCIGAPETERYVRYAPDGLAAALNQGKTPEWLDLVEGFGHSDTDYVLYHVLK